MQRYMGSVSVHKALFKEVKERYFEEWFCICAESIFEGSEEKTLRRMQRCMGSKSVDKALSMKVDKSLVERMLLGISSVSVQKAFLKEAKKRHIEECNDTWIQKWIKDHFEECNDTWVQYLCMKHYPRKWIKDHYEECNEHRFSTCEESIVQGSG
ncbi:Large ribosomal subunit protein [Trichinella pseudospiralis]